MTDPMQNHVPKKTAIITTNRPPVLAQECKNKNIPFENILQYFQSGLTYGEIAKLCDCSESNIRQRLQIVVKDKGRVDYFRENKSQFFEGLQANLFSLTNEEIKEMTPSQRVVAGAIVYDKQRLEDGKSTSNIFNLQSFAHNEAKMDELVSKLEKLGVAVSDIEP